MMKTNLRKFVPIFCLAFLNLFHPIAVAEPAPSRPLTVSTSLSTTAEPSTTAEVATLILTPVTVTAGTAESQTSAASPASCP